MSQNISAIFMTNLYSLDHLEVLILKDQEGLYSIKKTWWFSTKYVKSCFQIVERDSKNMECFKHPSGEQNKEKYSTNREWKQVRM